MPMKKYRSSEYLADSTLNVQFHSVENVRSSRLRQSRRCKLCSWHNASAVSSPQPDVAGCEPVTPKTNNHVHSVGNRLAVTRWSR